MYGQGSGSLLIAWPWFCFGRKVASIGRAGKEEAFSQIELCTWWEEDYFLYSLIQRVEKEREVGGGLEVWELEGGRKKYSSQGICLFHREAEVWR